MTPLPAPPSKADDADLRVCVLHTQASTGGTLLSRCLSLLPDVLLLNEVSPAGESYDRFNAADPLEQAIARDDIDLELDTETRLGLFCDRLRPVLDHARKTGRILILREHSHSETMLGRDPDLTLLNALARMGIAPRSCLLLRYPLSSYITARSSGFLRHVSNFDAYFLHYARFMKRHAGTGRVLYETFTSEPEPVLNRICETFGLTPDPTVLDRFRKVSLAGNSGRYGRDRQIHPTIMRPVQAPTIALARRSQPFRDLCTAMGYAADPLVYARNAVARVLAFDPEDKAALAEMPRLDTLERALRDNGEARA